MAAAKTVNLPAANDSANNSAVGIFPRYYFDAECVSISEAATDIDTIHNIGAQKVIGFDTDNKVETNNRRRLIDAWFKDGLL